MPGLRRPEAASLGAEEFLASPAALLACREVFSDLSGLRRLRVSP